MSYYEQPTQQFPALPPANGGNAPPIAQPATGYPATYAPAQYGPIPVVPPRRGAGFWVGITAAIAAGVVLSLLGGFFIGRGSRLSNGDVQSKITQQQQADQIAQQQLLSAQKAADQTAEDKAVTQAHKSGEADGLRQGSIQGQQQGFQQGQQAGYQQGQAAGQAQGQQQGFQQGQQQGFNQGQSSGFNQGFNSGQCSALALVC